MSEKPDTVHGRLLESVHISGYSLERAVKEFKWLLEEDRWKLCGDGFEAVDDFLETVSLSQFKMAIEERKEISRLLEAQRATQRAIAKTIGVDQSTIHRDLAPDANASETSATSSVEQGDSAPADTPDANASAPSPTITQDGAEAAATIDRVVEDQQKKQWQRDHPINKEDNIPDEIPEPSIEPSLGGVYELGRHILYCGDSSQGGFIRSLKKYEAALAFADPPYNEETEEWDKGFEWKHDYLSDVAPIVAVTPGISNIQSFMRATDMPYKWALSVFINNGMTRGAVGFGNWMFIALFTKGSVYRTAQDHYEVSIKATDRDALSHKGRKPMGVLRILLDLFTEKDGIVVDPFLGTGTTLVVAEEMGRRCIGAEINPDYCASIIARWEQMTDGEATQIG